MDADLVHLGKNTRNAPSLRVENPLDHLEHSAPLPLAAELESWVYLVVRPQSQRLNSLLPQHKSNSPQVPRSPVCKELGGRCTGT